MLLGLADLSLVEAKTERAELFSRIGLDDPSNGKSTLVPVQDRSGANVGELILGKRKFDRLGGGNDGVYVRKPGADRTWLARGTVEATASRSPGSTGASSTFRRSASPR